MSLRNVALALWLWPLLVQAAPEGATIAKQGNVHAASACVSCHGANGIGLAGANFARLAGLDRDYLAKQLHDFKLGARENPVMQPIAAALSDDEIYAVARYFAGLPKPAVSTEKVSAENLARGEVLARQGNWSKELPACFQCHGENGTGVPPNFPAITGQPAAYIVAQLNAWRSGARHNDPVKLMATVSSKLSEEDAKAVAEYLASGSPLGKTK